MDCDRFSAAEVQVSAGVAIDHAAAGDKSPWQRIFGDVHTAAFTGLVAGNDAVGHRERAVVVHVHATAADSRVAGDFTA